LSSFAPLESQVRSRLQGHTDTPGLDAQVLLGQILGRPRSWVLAHPEVILSKEQAEYLEQALARLEQGEPLPYVLGHWEFFGLDFTVTPQVLIPRPETELLVESALGWLRAHPGRRLGLDVGTGAGCIAVSLAVHVADLRLVASDLSSQALRVAQINLQRHSLHERVFCLQADLLPPVCQPVDIICANLPYIPSHTLQGLRVRYWQPSLALDGGADGLRLIRRLLKTAPAVLAPGGVIFLEIEQTLGAAAVQLARAEFAQSGVELIHDLAGRPRLICIQA
jgi:release factor glutamine methyltransferase